MSIVINLYYTGENGSARKFAEEMERGGTADLIRQESGNERYAYFFPMNDPGTVLLIDIWKDQASIDQHHASPMMERLRSFGKSTICICAQSDKFVTEMGFPQPTRNL